MERSKRRRSSANGARVIQLSSYKRSLQTFKQPRRIAFYVTTKSELSSGINELTHLETHFIRNWAELYCQISMRIPEIIILDNNLDWSHPNEILSELNRHFQAPSLVIFPNRKVQRKLVKQTYSAGAFDVLFAPVVLEDLAASIQILLQFPGKMPLIGQ